MYCNKSGLGLDDIRYRVYHSAVEMTFKDKVNDNGRNHK